jgi:type II secretory pathway pseudopilin PulG
VAGSWSGCSNVDHDHDESWLRCAGCIAVRRPAARSLHGRLAPPAAAAGTDVYGQGRTPSRRSWTILTILIMLLGLINAAGYLGGSRAAVLATAAVLIMATVTRLVAQYRRRRSARQARADVAHACTALASYLRVGQVPSAALPIAAADCDVLREGQQAHTPSAGTWQLYGASRRSVSGTEAFLSWRVPGRSRWCKVCDITLPRLATCDGASGRCWLGRSAYGRSDFDT